VELDDGSTIGDDESFSSSFTATDTEPGTIPSDGFDEDKVGSLSDTELEELELERQHERTGLVLSQRKDRRMLHGELQKRLTEGRQGDDRRKIVDDQQDQYADISRRYRETAPPLNYKWMFDNLRIQSDRKIRQLEEKIGSLRKELSDFESSPITTNFMPISRSKVGSRDDFLKALIDSAPPGGWPYSGRPDDVLRVMFNYRLGKDELERREESLALEDNEVFNTKLGTCATTVDTRDYRRTHLIAYTQFGKILAWTINSGDNGSELSGTFLDYGRSVPTKFYDWFFKEGSRCGASRDPYGSGSLVCGTFGKSKLDEFKEMVSILGLVPVIEFRFNTPRF
jgi:hypothetical protein